MTWLPFPLSLTPLSRKLFKDELQSKWPNSHWDHWLRSPEINQHREIVYPQVPPPPPTHTLHCLFHPHHSSVSSDPTNLPQRREGDLYESGHPQPILPAHRLQPRPSDRLANGANICLPSCGLSNGTILDLRGEDPSPAVELQTSDSSRGAPLPRLFGALPLLHLDRCGSRTGNWSPAV
jgi:hypothetical protein